VIVVLDSGVWVSALQFGGIPLLALERGLTVDTIAVCDQIVVEVARVLTEKMDWEPGRLRQSLGLYLRDAVRVPVRGLVRGVCRDPKDDMVLECAIQAAAGLIVSGDKDLLAVGSHGGVRIVAPRDYVLLKPDSFGAR
jgi:putative PIN family toxin of toxin-antitoxin system